jgi:hypothetical protein
MQRGPGSAEGTGAASEKERKFLIPAFWSDIMEAKMVIFQWRIK